MPELTVASFQAHLRSLKPPQQWVLGFSGGLDSRVLLDLLARSQKSMGSHLVVVHIHHGLQAEADAWAQFCHTTADSYAVPCQVVRLQHPLPAGGGLEERARLARRAVWRDRLKPDQALFLAHHLNDQAETLIMRWCKGAGLAALAGIKSQSQLAGRPVLRPLLSFSQAQIEAYARAQQLSWISDPSNQHEHYERNFIRHQILPKLLSRYPQALHKMQDMALACERSSEHWQAEREADLAGLVDEQGRLSIEGLQHFATDYQVDLMRQWLHGFAPIYQSKQFWQRILTEIIKARPDSQPQLPYGPFWIRRFKGQLWCCLPAQDLPPMPQVWSWQVPWQVGQLKLWTELRLGEGIAYKHLPKLLSIHCGKPEARVQPKGWPHHQSLQKCWQKLKVAPWLRPRIPLIYLAETLIAAPNYFVVDSFAAKPDEQGLVFLQSGFI